MELRRRSHDGASSSSATTTTTTTAKASDALPLPLHLTNVVFFTLFFSLAYYLLNRWRDKIRSSSPLHHLSLPDIAAIFALLASFIYLLGFFGIHFVQSFIAPRSSDDIDLSEQPSPEPLISSDIDAEIVDSVLAGTVPSYALESRLGDCRRAAAIRREALQRMTGRSLQGLPLEGFDYESILGQCCEMPVGYVQIPVGVAGPLLLDGVEYTVPMATTEGCLVASANRGCKAIYASGGADSVVLRDGMSRAPVVRFASANRAAQLKLFLEDPLNFDNLAVVFNRSEEC